MTFVNRCVQKGNFFHSLLGGILAGVISDQTHCSGITCVGFLVLATPSVSVFCMSNYRVHQKKERFGNQSYCCNSNGFSMGPFPFSPFKLILKLKKFVSTAGKSISKSVSLESLFEKY